MHLKPSIPLKRKQVLELEQLDSLLDVPVSRFPAVVARLVRTFKSKDLELRVVRPDSADRAHNPHSRPTWTRLYEAEVGRLPRMDRPDEFRMARRYEFLKARARAALQAAGFPSEELDDLLKRPRSGVPAPPGRASQAQRRYLERCLEDLERLRTLYVEGALYMVLGCAYRYRGLGVDLADLVQEGSASLFQAIDGFDWRRDVRFRTYAQYWIHQAILKVLYNTSRTVRIPIWVQKTLRKIQKLQERDGGTEPGRELSSAEIGGRLGMPAAKVEELLRTRRRSSSLDAEAPGGDGTSLGQMLADDRSLPVHETAVDGDLRESLDEVLADLPHRERAILCRRFGLESHVPETLSEIAQDLGITAERVRQLQNAALGRLRKPRKLQQLAAFV